MQHILAIDDDLTICELLEDYLAESGYRVTTLNSGERILEILETDCPDLILLDVNMPGEDGLSCVRKIRVDHIDLPIIMLTGRDEHVDRVVGLEMGADDYMGKPFNLRELLARIKAVLRRSEARQTAKVAQSVTVTFAGWEFIVDARRLVSPEGQKVKLTNTEFNLLLALVENPKKVLSRDQLLEHSRKHPDEVFDRAIDYSIMQLRRKLEQDPQQPEMIKTERGLGYFFAVDVTTKA